ncbi:tRNA splicing ligase RtcB [Corynebacterium phage Adelaide]|uniref:3'-phosphate/5'-hydroxy nucleic acid ligase n=1 Tax=Corynebacterium phage Adelaide TaxID=2588499 RepID=A0A514DKM5_9CAUD|nr:tRNA splicing ligase RtcB [Corynebacterium phage Adelaide]QDH94132.1 hypothetical protein SEA_ADELAIDE_56 [Corynebacterium phage Adelaide]
MTAPQLELFASTLITPAPADQCGALTAQADGHGYEPPARRASIESANLHNGFAGRLIWCRPDDRAASAASVRWRRIVSTDTSHPDWTARSVTAADPDGTTHRCGLPQSCSIAVTAADLDNRMTGIVYRPGAEWIDEIPDAYKPIDQVMEDAADLVGIVHELRQIMNVKGT